MEPAVARHLPMFIGAAQRVGQMAWAASKMTDNASI
jgi:hypothetical protein